MSWWKRVRKVPVVETQICAQCGTLGPVRNCGGVSNVSHTSKTRLVLPLKIYDGSFTVPDLLCAPAEVIGVKMESDFLEAGSEQ